MIRDMTKGKPFPIIIRFCVPIFLGSLLQQIYNLADAFIIRKFVGLDEMGAVLSTGSLHFLVIGFVIGLTTGFSIPVSKSFGAGNVSEMRKRAVNAFYLSGIFSIALTVITVVFIKQLLLVMQTPPQTIDAAYRYIIVLFGGISAIMSYQIMVAILRALGDSRTPLYFLAIGGFINVLLDVLFIAAFKWGTAGAAWATVASVSLSSVVCLFHIKKNHPVLAFKKEELRFCRKRCAELIKNGVPMALQFSITAVGSVIIQSAVNGFGPVVVSAIGTAARIQILIMQPMEALGITMATYCAQNLGAAKLHRIKKGIFLSMITVLVYSVCAGLFIIFMGRVLAFFIIGSGETSGTDAESIKEAMGYIKRFQLVNGSLYWLLGILFIVRNSVQGLGYSRVTVFAGVSELLARGGVAFMLVPFFGFNAVCFANPLAWLFADILLIIVLIVLVKRLSKISRHELRNHY
ncbi:MAG: MATE family efflux transporter [Oscillospiraceae bacterium]|nr:MATE family efflux transporter [Oscillospiraceae bacterium]